MVKCNGPSDHACFGECMKYVYWCIPLAFLLHVSSSLPKSSLHDSFQRLKTYLRSITSNIFLNCFSLLTSCAIFVGLTKVAVNLLHFTVQVLLLLCPTLIYPLSIYLCLSPGVKSLYRALKEIWFTMQPLRSRKNTCLE